MGSQAVLSIAPLNFPWQTLDPFLFCVYHQDAYPNGNEHLGPEGSLAGRAIGQDFQGRDGWRMYHGRLVPGFPQHPHRGFETVTIVRQGFIDHSDSVGATARYGEGDVQWLTAGRGVLHSEMFPLLKRDAPNPLELFQIWLNLPRRSKMVAPYFSMFWRDTLPRVTLVDPGGRSTRVTLIAGALDGLTPPAPPPDSWASQPESQLAIWTAALAPHAQWTLRAAPEGVNRALYVFSGTGVVVEGEPVSVGTMVSLRASVDATIRNGSEPTEVLMLQGRPIGEPVAQYGPFVMNTDEEIRQAFDDFRRTGFGGWPWDVDDPVHPRAQARFAKHPDGRTETPTT